MDIQQILKTVISLADVVIKNPSTSVQNSGIDLSAITNIAGSLLGGSNTANSNASSGSGLGSILGGALASGALGKLGGNLGSLGSLAGSLLGGGQTKTTESNNDLLGQLVSQAGTITNMLGGNTSQNLSSDQKTNLTDVLNIINVAKTFVNK